MYNHKQIEKKWQKRWEEEQTFKTDDNSDKPTQYILDMFPYPSSNGLHVGHPEGYTATDIYCRYLRMRGHEVLHPMGWDAFGLPAENYAIKQGVHPQKTTEKNIKTFRRQIQSLGFSYDWSREINTSSPEYYRWTQWLFSQLYKQGLAYKKKAPVNWCENCQTVLANEQVVNGVCERCKNPVIQKELEQWFFKVTHFAEELLSCLDSLDWPESIKAAQRNWIGKSEGARIEFRITNHESRIIVFTTRPDTLFGATYVVLAPEHKLVDELKNSIANWSDVERYRTETRGKSELERAHLEKEKTGVPLKDITAINPANGEEIPVWIADYVLSSYGTGAIMAVPAHDERDFEFAKKYGLPINMVVCPNYPSPTCPILDEAYPGKGHLVDSGEFNGMKSEEAKWAITKKVVGEKVTQYRLRDWLVSRQRYWGAPIPIIYCETCGEQPVPEIDLPVVLPTDVDFRPTGESPLTRSKTFHTVSCPSCGKPARREADTMDTFVCSSWYYLRYISPTSTTHPFDEELLSKWLPVDLYVGGAEHAVLHLLYARFITKALRDGGFLKFDEPFTKLKNQGMILGEDGEKMSKSRGNVINPDEVVLNYGADTLRVYEMFMGPFEQAKPWNTSSIIGTRRFLERIWKLYTEQLKLSETVKNKDLTKLLHKTIKKVTEDIVSFNFNTAISALMILLNEMQSHATKNGGIEKNILTTLLSLLSPLAPHIAEELNEKMDLPALAFSAWPVHDPALIADQTVKLVIQINGKVRDTLEVSADLDEEEVKKLALQREIVQKWVERKTVSKIFVVKGRLISIVVV